MPKAQITGIIRKIKIAELNLNIASPFPYFLYLCYYTY
jgi:hypothetical protein